MIEMKHFLSYNEYINFLGKLVDKNEAKRIAEHEREHYNKAVGLGYKPRYAAQLTVEMPPILDYGCIDFEGEVSREDMISICLAPKRPGRDDRILARMLRRSRRALKIKDINQTGYNAWG